ncbi:MAG: pantetheine-phosphate adenylyltransferase, partial [Humidesulfovibrio sp.]|nr:pantetheine-phosphate adenylyltransferase [Humidesulfovibrio sp.]
LMTDYKWMYLSSTIVKEVSLHGGNVKGLVPEPVLLKLSAKYAALSGHR